jgi:TRAP-type mannitol/chloroaromatic compound transport system substrate-binding protein
MAPPRSIAKKVAGLTDNKFQIRVFAPGEIVPALQALDAVQNNTVEMCHYAGYYFVGKDPTFGFDAGVPFGLTARQQNAWMLQGGGLQLMREFMADYNAVPFPPATPARRWAAGSARRSRRSTTSRASRCASPASAARSGQARRGAAADRRRRHLSGAGDAVRSTARSGWGRYDDEKLGFYKVAPFYYYPGFWEAGTQITLMVGKQHWDALPAAYKLAVETVWATSTAR